uniref:Transmembrane protein n=1 Tax=Eucheuma denticulatum TaxID=305493 RepID=A0A8E7PGA1_9FLOR|nr:hypothetical protein [Eucheuma denticulatum]
MIKYWPQNQSFELNKQVANLFSNTRQKFSYNLFNKTNDNLYLDLLDNLHKKQLFTIVLIEVEIVLLDIIELDVSIEMIQLLSYKILYDIIQKSVKRFYNKTESIYKNIDSTNCKSYYLQITLSEYKWLLECLLIYLIYGTSQIKKNIFVFDNTHTPSQHVSILFENLVIQISDLVICIIVESIQSLSNIIFFIRDYGLCNSSYVSFRSIALFRNNLILQNFIRFYINQPKAIYSSRYKVWLLSSDGLVSKYIYISRLEDISSLSTIQLVSLFLIEIQDLIIVKLEKFLLVLTKLFIYILINLLSNSIIFCIRSIVVSINNISK